MEHWEELKPGGLRFVWADHLFRPGTDTFLLSSLPRLRPGLRVCDLGCGTGLLGFLLLQRQPDLRIAGLDIQPEAAALARRAAAENGLMERLDFRCGDLRQVRGIFPTGCFDLVVCNPPYYPPAAPPGRKRRHLWPISAPPHRICCAGAGNSVWCTSRSGWQTCSAPSGTPARKPSGCASSTAGQRIRPPSFWRRAAGAAGRESPWSRPSSCKTATAPLRRS